jgi:hypothetical protein
VKWIPGYFGNFDLTWSDTGAWELWESDTDVLGSGAAIASGPSGTTYTLTKSRDTVGGWYYALRGTSPVTAFVALAQNPLYFDGVR